MDAKGYSLIVDSDNNETFSPVAKLNSVRMFISLGTNLNRSLHQLDVKTAFLQGDLHEEVYMQQPPGFVTEGESHKVCKINKSIYGLKQSPRAWFEKFNTILSEFGFVRGISDYSVFVRRTTRGCIIMKDLGQLQYFLRIEYQGLKKVFF